MPKIHAALVSADAAPARRDNGHMAEALKQQWIHAYEGMAEVGGVFSCLLVHIDAVYR